MGTFWSGPRARVWALSFVKGSEAWGQLVYDTVIMGVQGFLTRGAYQYWWAIGPTLDLGDCWGLFGAVGADRGLLGDCGLGHLLLVALLSTLCGPSSTGSDPIEELPVKKPKPTLS